MRCWIASAPSNERGLAVDQGFGTRWRGMDELFGSFQNTLIVYGPTMATQHQDTGRRFMIVHIELGNQQLVAHGDHLIEKTAPRPLRLADDL